MLATHSYYEKMDLAQETQMDVNFFTTRVIRIKKWEASEKETGTSTVARDGRFQLQGGELKFILFQSRPFEARGLFEASKTFLFAYYSHFTEGWSQARRRRSFPKEPLTTIIGQG